MHEYFLSAEMTHSRWNRTIPPRLEVESGDIIHAECLDATGGQLKAGSTLADFSAIDSDKAHALTGPISIYGAQPGDVLQIDLLEIRHKGWGWSGIVPKLGFLPERFRERFFFVWELEEWITQSLEPAIVPLRPFCGVVGLAPAELGEFRAQLPGLFGGNLDVRELTGRATLFLPIFNTGGLLSLGGVHAAQGDGEVSITGIECPANVSIRVSLHRGRRLQGPFLQSAPVTMTSSGEWVTVESGNDALEVARRATDRMIDFLMAGWHILPEHAYILCSVAMDLRLGQVVNAGQITVSATLRKSILPLLTAIEGMTAATHSTF